MLKINKKQTLLIKIFVLVCFTFLINIINTKALSLVEEERAKYNLNTGGATFNFNNDIIYFTNNNYTSVNVLIKTAAGWRTDESGNKIYYFLEQYNNPIFAKSGSPEMIYMSIPSAPKYLLAGDAAQITLTDSSGATDTRDLTSFGYKSCDVMAKYSPDKTVVEVYKCGTYNYSTKKVEYSTADELNRQNNTPCYPDYERTTTPTLITDTCKDSTFTSNSYGLQKRLCSQVYRFNCALKGATSASLSSLVLNEGTLSPKFSAKTYTYSAQVTSPTLTISATASSGGTFVTGYGPRTIPLSYGSNNVYVKVQGTNGNITTYTIDVFRPEDRSNVMTLSSLSATNGKLVPAFDPVITKYEIYVAKDATDVTINATRTDESSKFMDNYGPRQIMLTESTTLAYIKIVSAMGNTFTYDLIIKKGDAPDYNTTDALLTGVDVNKTPIPDFAETTYEYNYVVPFETTSAIIEAHKKTEADNVVVNNPDKLEVGENTVEIIVTTPSNYVRKYTIHINRKEEGLDPSKNPEIKNIKITGYEFKYEQNETEYDLKLKKGDTSLKIEVTPEDAKSVVTIEGNKNLRLGSKITVTSTAEDGSMAKYYINITGVEKGSNKALIVILVILIILLVVYIVLRLLGYKIYFNFSMIGSMFRSIGQKIKNIFDR